MAKTKKKKNYSFNPTQLDDIPPGMLDIYFVFWRRKKLQDISEACQGFFFIRKNIVGRGCGGPGKDMFSLQINFCFPLIFFCPSVGLKRQVRGQKTLLYLKYDSYVSLLSMLPKTAFSSREEIYYLGLTRLLNLDSCQNPKIHFCQFLVIATLFSFLDRI